MSDNKTRWPTLPRGLPAPPATSAPQSAAAYRALNRAAWTVTASAGIAPANTIDGDPATAYSSGVSQNDGELVLTVDMGSAQAFDRVVLDSSQPNIEDYAHKLILEWSNDGESFTPILESLAVQTVTVLDFPHQNHRYWHVRCLPSGNTGFWHVCDLAAYAKAA